MTNLSRLKHMNSAELASELERIRNSESLPYVDFKEWLASSDETLLPSGRMVNAVVLIRERTSRVIVERKEIQCIVISDHDILFGSRYYSIYDCSDGKIKSIPFDSLDILGW